MRVTFYLKDSKAKRETPIYARISLNGKPVLKYYLQQSIEPKHWNQKEQEARRTLVGYSTFNHLLRSRAADIEDAYRNYVIIKKSEPTKATLKQILDEKIKPEAADNDAQGGFFAFYNKFIEQAEKGVKLNHRGKVLAKGTIKSYRNTLKYLQSFQATVKRPVDFETIDLEFYSSFREYLSKKCLQGTNSVDKHIKTLKTVLNDATERGINKNMAFRGKGFKRISEKVDTIYLTEAEIQLLAEVDLKGRKGHEQVRDLFIIGCHTGLRFSDLSRVKPENIKGGFIELTQQKTGEPVVIPVHRQVAAILDKYDGDLPPAITNQKTNQYLKEIAKAIPGFMQKHTKSFTKGGTGITQNLEKWKLISSHTARRSFATNNYLNGVPAITIMAITGHKTEKAFMNYIKVTPREHAKLIVLSWEKMAAKEA